MKYDTLEEKIAREIEDFHDDYNDPLLVNEILDGIEDLDENPSPTLNDALSQQLDPLDRIDQEEKEISKNKDYNDLESKFILSNNIAAMNIQKFNNIIYEPNVNISEKLYNYYFDKGMSTNTPLGSNFGIPRCITVFIFY